MANVRTRPSFGRLLKWAAIALVLAQVIRPSRTNPPVDPSRTLQASGIAPPAVLAIIDRSCKDCHTHGTEWPWYSNIAPASWLLASDVARGRRHVNFSDWAGYDPKTMARKLTAICENVTNGEMPMSSYVLVHETAALSEDDKKVLCAWTETVTPKAAP